ncbi:MAG: aminopeptidase P family protein [Lachnospiraceae bacterium]|nr:aminopeptidase P family protein [Lachnospiraceae bacterium]
MAINMENQIIVARLQTLRTVMQESGIDYYLIPTADFHNSEYVNEYFKVREFFSNFSGSNGTLVVGMDEAGLWTDGRYFIQAATQLEGTGITLYKMGEEGVPTVRQFLADKMTVGQTLGFDGRVITVSFGKKLETELADKKIKLAYKADLADKVWKDRPSLPSHPVYVLSDELCGESTQSKLARVREKMSEAGCQNFFLSKLDDLMWLFNIRGGDIECNPVALCYALIKSEQVVLFLQESEITNELRQYAEKNKIELRDYHETADYLQNCKLSGKMLYDEGEVSYLFYRLFSKNCDCVAGINPTERMKAIKNETELANMRKIYEEDSAVLTKFIYWLKKNVGKFPMNEYSVAMHLDDMRSKIDSFLDLSFPTISGYKENAAMMHYSATKEHNKELAAEGMYLVDSGGQYLGGTTDVTRTLILGRITEEQKMHFTKVAVAVMRLANAKWLYGCSGRNLDILAREPLWELEIDYKCGTGHGVGYILNVHEGPQNIRWKYNEEQKEAVIEAGMDISDEPGVYKEGSHGIRTENILVARNDVKNSDGQFMSFENLTWVPIDRDGLDTKYMNEDDIRQLNAYHEQVYQRLAPYMDEDERKWLAEATSPL